MSRTDRQIGARLLITVQASMPGRLVRLGGVTAMAVTTLSTFALAACSSHDSNPLFANDWTLTSAIDDGKPVDTALGVETRWRFSGHGGCGDTSLHCPDGQKVVGTIVCNDFTLSLQADTIRIVWGDEGETT